METLTPEEFAERLREAADKGGFHRSLVAEFKAAALQMEAAAKVNAKTRMGQPTGRLAASIAGVTREKPGGVESAVGSGSDHARAPVVYARIQELGGEVRPKRGKYLAIPIGAARLPRGGAVYSTARLDPTPMAFVRSLKGQPLLVDAATAEPRYLLRTLVRIRPKFYLRDAVETIAPQLEGSLVSLLARVLGGSESAPAAGPSPASA
jgi:hypothetical protein